MPAATTRLTADGFVPADPARVHALLADYRTGHPSIIPRPPFTDLVVETGGTGEGTVFTVGVRLLGRTQTARFAVTVPAPGRVLAETDPVSGLVTTFTTEPEGAGTRLTIRTDFPVRAGLLGRLEGALLRRLFAPVYARELALVAAAFAGPVAAGGPEA